MPYSSGDYQSTTRPALILRPDIGIFTTPFYFDGWAQTNFVPQGITSTVEIWLQDQAYDGGGGPAPLWYLWDTVDVSAENWYPFHQTLSGFHGSGYSGQISAVAILSSRSDDSTNGGIYFDDLYVYGELGLSPFCNGTYPAITKINTGPGGGGIDNTAPLDYPRNKPCPPDLYVPNNFWGPLLAGITLFLDKLFAFAPIHELNSLRLAAADYVVSPLQFVIDLSTTFFDLRVVMWAFGLILLLNGVRAVLAVWWTIKDSIPFL